MKELLTVGVILGGMILHYHGEAVASTKVWTIDPQHSVASFKIKHLAITNVRGSVSGIEGTVEENTESGEIPSIQATLDAGTINTSNEKRDAHLKSADFFDVAKFAQFRFQSMNVKNGTVEGNLTIHGVTKKVTLSDLSLSAPTKDVQGKLRRALAAQATINRKDFGLTWNKTLDGGGILIGDEVRIEIELELQG